MVLNRELAKEVIT